MKYIYCEKKTNKKFKLIKIENNYYENLFKKNFVCKNKIKKIKYKNIIIKGTTIKKCFYRLLS